MEWKIEELKLMNSAYKTGYHTRYPIENEVSREEMIEFVDQFTSGKLSYILELEKKFKEDESTLKKDEHGNIKTTSLIAWIKRNDTKYGEGNHSRVIDCWYKYGRVYLLGVERYIDRLNHKMNYEVYDDFVKDVFNRCLRERENDEKNYFLKHDEYSVLKKKLKECSDKFGTTFGVNISYSSDGNIYIVSTTEDGWYDNKREITIDECKILISKYEELENVIKSISSTVNIVYETDS